MAEKRYDTTPYTYRVKVYYGLTDSQAHDRCPFPPAVVDEAEDGALVCFESLLDHEIWLETA